MIFNVMLESVHLEGSGLYAVVKTKSYMLLKN
jgi:hypothetical protein